MQLDVEGERLRTPRADFFRPRFGLRGLPLPLVDLGLDLEGAGALRGLVNWGLGGGVLHVVGHGAMVTLVAELRKPLMARRRVRNSHGHRSSLALELACEATREAAREKLRLAIEAMCQEDVAVHFRCSARTIARLRARYDVYPDNLKKHFVC